MVGDRFLVVGAGALGLASAEALLQQGAEVTVLEQGAVGQESSWAGGGILSPLCPWDYPAEVTQLTTRGAGLFGAWAENLHRATGIDPEYETSGMLVLPPFDLSAAQSWCAEHGVKGALNKSVRGEYFPFAPSLDTAAPTWDEREMYRTTAFGLTQCPHKFAPNDGSLLLPDVAQVRNPRLLQSLRARVEQLGGRIIEHCEVKLLSVERGTVCKVMTSRGEFSAGGYVITAGAWSKQLLGAQALQLDIKPIRGQMLLFKFAAPPLPHIVLQDGLYLIPRRDGHLLVGSTLEDVGFDKSTTIDAREMLLQRAVAILPALRDMPPVKHWAGLRPGSTDNIPTIGRHPHLENLYINNGHFRYGVTMAPASVEVLLNEINGLSQPFDVSPYVWR